MHEEHSVIDYGEVTDSTKLYQLIKDLLDAYRDNIERINAVAQGDLVNAATYAANKWQLEWKGERLELSLTLPKHWQFIERGRGPTMRSEGGKLYPAILEWIRVKKIIPRGGWKANIPHPKQEAQLAHAITRKIHREGYFSPNHHGKWPLRDAIGSVDLAKRMAGVLTDQFNKAISVELADAFDLSKK